jgi:hypothetical protein
VISGVEMQSFTVSASDLMYLATSLSSRSLLRNTG